VSDISATVRPERQALAADLEAIDEAAWATPSLCPGWTVRDVLAHITALARMTPALFFQKLAASRFSLARLQYRDIAAERGGSPEETLARFRRVTASKNRLPGTDKIILGETLVHAEDIRRPLGITHRYPLGALVTVAELYQGSDLITGTKTRIAGLSLHAVDIGWSTGSGPMVSGPMLPMVMAMAGRSAAIENLEGDGVVILRSRV
jgi:uncharacterized protein (TIGR03083 family)